MADEHISPGFLTPSAAEYIKRAAQQTEQNRQHAANSVNEGDVQDFPAVITSGAGGYHAWTEQAFDENGERYTKPDGRTGTAAVNPACLPDRSTIAAAFLPHPVWLRRTLWDATYGIIYEIVSDSVRGISVTDGTTTVTNVTTLTVAPDAAWTITGTTPNATATINYTDYTVPGIISTTNQRLGGGHKSVTSLGLGSVSTVESPIALYVPNNAGYGSNWLATFLNYDPTLSENDFGGVACSKLIVRPTQDAGPFTGTNYLYLFSGAIDSGTAMGGSAAVYRGSITVAAAEVVAAGGTEFYGSGGFSTSISNLLSSCSALGEFASFQGVDQLGAPSNIQGGGLTSGLSGSTFIADGRNSGSTQIEGYVVRIGRTYYVGHSATPGGLGFKNGIYYGGTLSVNLATEVTGTLTVGNGGTGAASFTAGQLLAGNGTSALDPATGTRIVSEALELKLAADSWVAFTEGSF